MPGTLAIARVPGMFFVLQIEMPSQAWISFQSMLYYKHKRNNRPQGVGRYELIETPPFRLAKFTRVVFLRLFQDFKEKRYLRLLKIKVSNAMSSSPKAIRSWKLKDIRIPPLLCRVGGQHLAVTRLFQFQVYQKRLGRTRDPGKLIYIICLRPICRDWDKAFQCLNVCIEFARKIRLKNLRGIVIISI